MYKKDVALNNLQWLLCHKTKPHTYMYIGSGIKKPRKIDMP